MGTAEFGIADVALKRISLLPDITGLDEKPSIAVAD